MYRKSFYVYILTNKTNSVLYTGITRDLCRRVIEHKSKLKLSSFTAKYNVNKLVYYEVYTVIIDAIAREKQIKGGSRKKKELLITSTNAEWDDIYLQLEG